MAHSMKDTASYFHNFLISNSCNFQWSGLFVLCAMTQLTIVTVATGQYMSLYTTIT